MCRVVSGILVQAGVGCRIDSVEAAVVRSRTVLYGEMSHLYTPFSAYTVSKNALALTC